MTIPEDKLREYHEEGYMILENYFSREEVEVMKSACDEAIAEMDRRIDAGDPGVAKINHKGKRYFLPHVASSHPRLEKIVFGEKMAEVVRGTLGMEAYHFLDQYVVKAAETGMQFSWHQDAGYIKHARVRPYLTNWIPLDDVTVENGTVYILPFSRAGSRELVDHAEDPDTHDQVGYHGTDPGIPVEVPAGTLVSFTSHTFHRSTPNTTPHPRRVYLIQYSPEIIRNPDGAPRNGSAQFLRQGQVVAG